MIDKHLQWLISCSGLRFLISITSKLHQVLVAVFAFIGFMKNSSFLTYHSRIIRTDDLLHPLRNQHEISKCFPKKWKGRTLYKPHVFPQKRKKTFTNHIKVPQKNGQGRPFTNQIRTQFWFPYPHAQLIHVRPGHRQQLNGLWGEIAGDGVLGIAAHAPGIGGRLAQEKTVSLKIQENKTMAYLICSVKHVPREKGHYRAILNF